MPSHPALSPISRTSGRWPRLASLGALTILACGGQVQPGTAVEDVQQVTGNVGTMAAPPTAATTIAFEAFKDDVGTRGASETRTLIRSARGYQTFFGHAPPAAVDFTHEWVMFYAAGTKPNGGYEASFLALLQSGRNLIAITHLVSPGAGCVTTQAETMPAALIKFPAQPGTVAEFFRQDGTNDCNAQLCAAVQCPAGTNCDPKTGKCAPVCPPVCQIFCENGNVLDANGCATCKCNPPPTDPCATVKCAAGTHCDAGKCLSDGMTCGGIAGRPCPGFGKCVDNPNDSCDPKTGGADCGGICSCVQNVACTADSKFDSSPAVCACVPIKPPVCGPVCDIFCDYGNVLDANGCATCKCNPPPADPCANVKCAAGTHCDAGKCLSDGVTCGGIAGRPCPGLGKCVDNPNDSCDPKAGGADCGGICSCVQNVACTADSKFDSSPAVCACVPTKPPVCGPVCAIYCEYGNVLDANGCATCKCNPPPTDPCATVKCAAGTHCDTGKCLADSVSCGGFAGKPCPGLGKCVDNPKDSCDPKAGGADCSGICTCVQNVLCTADSKFDSSPAVCACVPLTSATCPPEKCPGPGPKSVSTVCADGSIAGPVCALSAGGTCGWTVRSCPTSTGP